MYVKSLGIAPEDENFGRVVIDEGKKQLERYQIAAETVNIFVKAVYSGRSDAIIALIRNEAEKQRKKLD